MYRYIIFIIGLGFLSGALHAEAPTAHRGSKIGVHLIGSYTSGSQKMIRGKMPILKILDLHQPMLDAARDYKAANPNGIVVLRCYTPVRYTLADNPFSTADRYWNTYFKPQMDKLSTSERKLIDYVEATNEMGECPTWENDRSIAWFTSFSIRWVSICVREGFRPCLASIPVGNPGGDISEVKKKILKYTRALRAAKRVGGAWSYHSYTIQYTTDVGVELWYSLRYRKFYEAFKGPYSDLADMPMILTEGGVDYGGNRDTDGWSARGSAEKFESWLRWFDSEIQKDPYVLGITLFQNGDPQNWKSFDLEPLSDWFMQYWDESVVEK